jgi:hypothetical protein
MLLLVLIVQVVAGYIPLVLKNNKSQKKQNTSPSIFVA